MPYTVAVAGKGGTGKTSFAAITLKLMRESKYTPILAVDADPNSNFGDSLGVSYDTTVSGILERTKGMRDVPAGMNKLQLVEMELQNCLVEQSGYDLIVMGRPEGPECYCAANNLLRTFMKKLAEDYPYIVIDNEAGMEHLSRKTTQNIDVLYLVSDYSLVGVRAAARIRDLCRELKLSIRDVRLVINKVTGELSNNLLDEVKRLNLELAGTVRFDSGVMEYELNNKPLQSLPADMPVVRDIAKIISNDRIKIG